MNELVRFVTVVNRIALYAIAACLIAWMFIEQYRVYIAGLALGICVSIVNAHYLSLKIRQISEQMMQRSGRRINIGFFTRAAIAVLAVMGAHRYDPFDPMTTAIGIFFVPAVILIVGPFLRDSN